MLKLVNINKNYGNDKEKIQALKNIDLKFRKNEFVTILGPSGCGKTTLLNIIGGLDYCDAGQFIINGENTENYNNYEWEKYRNHSVGFIFQNYNLIKHLSVLDNVTLTLTLAGVPKKEKIKKAKEALEIVGLSDKLYKKPNELSGGQIQRVAIARAIVNNPQIILADEPTGSLDSKTSIQIMEILKEISKEKLVIMVTHNSELAKEYSDRIVTMLDGTITSDTNPYIKEQIGDNQSKSCIKKPTMNFLESIKHSIKNILTKKTRTTLTVIANSIGIIGIALVLSLSNGLKKYINKLETDNISRYPITISEETINLDVVLNTINEDNSILDRYPSLKEITIKEISLEQSSLMASNNITKEYVDNVIRKIDSNLVNHIKYGSGVEMNLFVDKGLMKQEVNNKNMYVRLVTDYIWQELLDDQEFMQTNFDVLEGRLPISYNEVVVVVDRYNRMTSVALMDLGLYSEGQEKDTYTFDELMNLKFKLLTNDEMYYFEDEVYKLDGVNVLNNPMITETAYNKGEEISVVGIIRASENTNFTYLNTGIAYKSSLITHILEKNQNSSLVKYLNNNENVDPFTGNTYSSNAEENLYAKALKQYGADTTPTSIQIYPKDFESKEEIKKMLNLYNEDESNENKIIYMDFTMLIEDVSSSLINSVTYVLMALSCVSLLVSSIMMGITTYVSVMERQKEIGILRSLGARRQDVFNIFNSETIIIGLLSGLLGIIVALLLSFPINSTIGKLLPGLEHIVSFKFSYILILIVLSILLMFISGFIPSKMAANKKPIETLRSE